MHGSLALWPALLAWAQISWYLKQIRKDRVVPVVSPQAGASCGPSRRPVDPHPPPGSAGSTAGRRLDQPDAVIHAYRARSFDDGVYAGAGVERTRDVDPVVLGERLEDPGVPRKLLLGETGHDATWVG
jgi:hypothetical protein